MTAGIKAVDGAPAAIPGERTPVDSECHAVRAAGRPPM